MTRYGADSLIVPGFIDAHVHYPQLQMIGAGGHALIDWLKAYAFPAEQQFADADHAREVARVFLRELLRVGTTTAAVYCTVFPQSVDAFFEESARLNTRMIAGKVLMDRHAPVFWGSLPYENNLVICAGDMPASLARLLWEGAVPPAVPRATRLENPL